MLSILLSFTATSRWKVKEEEGKSCLIKGNCGLLLEGRNCSAILLCILSETVLYQPFSSEYFDSVSLMQFLLRRYSEKL